MQNTESIVDRRVILEGVNQMGLGNIDRDEVQRSHVVRQAAPLETRHQVRHRLSIEWGAHNVTARFVTQSNVQQMREQIGLEHQNVMIAVQCEGGLHQSRLVPRNARNHAMDDTSVVQNGQRVGKMHGLNGFRFITARTLIRIWLHHGWLVQVVVAHKEHTRFVGHDNQIQRRIVNA